MRCRCGWLFIVESGIAGKIKESFGSICVKKKFTSEAFKKYVQTNLKDTIRYNNMIFEHLFRLMITVGGPTKVKHGSSSIEIKQQTFEASCGVVLVQNANLVTDDPKLPPWHRVLFSVLDLDMDGKITKPNVAVWFNLFIASTLKEMCPSACYDSDEEDEDSAGFDYIDKIVDKFFSQSKIKEFAIFIYYIYFDSLFSVCTCYRRVQRR